MEGVTVRPSRLFTRLVQHTVLVHPWALDCSILQIRILYCQCRLITHTSYSYEISLAVPSASLQHICCCVPSNHGHLLKLYQQRLSLFSGMAERLQHTIRGRYTRMHAVKCRRSGGENNPIMFRPIQVVARWRDRTAMLKTDPSRVHIPYPANMCATPHLSQRGRGSFRRRGGLAR